LNAFAKAAYDLNLPNEDELSALKLHDDLFLSGFERILLVTFFFLPLIFSPSSLTSFLSLTISRQKKLCRSHARLQLHITRPCTSRLRATSPLQARHGMSCRGPCHASLVHRQHHWLAAPRRGRHHNQLGLPLCCRLRGARSHLGSTRSHACSCVYSACNPSCSRNKWVRQSRPCAVHACLDKGWGGEEGFAASPIIPDGSDDLRPAWCSTMVIFAASLSYFCVSCFLCLLIRCGRLTLIPR
jgi:hypothetical protein